jgi:hypothetical protein
MGGVGAAGTTVLHRGAADDRAVWLMTPSRESASAISLVPLRGGITTTLSAGSGPGSLVWRSNSVTPIITAMASTTEAVSRPEMRASSPPRSRTGRSGGGGAAVGLIASEGLRGDRRLGRAGSSEGIGVGAGSGRLRKNMDILFGPQVPAPAAAGFFRGIRAPESRGGARDGQFGARTWWVLWRKRGTLYPLPPPYLGDAGGGFRNWLGGSFWKRPM